MRDTPPCDDETAVRVGHSGTRIVWLLEPASGAGDAGGVYAVGGA